MSVPSDSTRTFPEEAQSGRCMLLFISVKLRDFEAAAYQSSRHSLKNCEVSACCLHFSACCLHFSAMSRSSLSGAALLEEVVKCLLLVFVPLHVDVQAVDQVFFGGERLVLKEGHKRQTALSSRC